MRYSSLLASLLLVTAGARAQDASPPLAFPDLPPFSRFVIDLEDPVDGEDRLYIVEHKGRVFSVPNDPAVTSADLFLDITDSVGQGTEQGIYSIAFHPDYVENGFFYIHYLTPEPFRSIIARYERSTDDPLVADPNSELVVLELDQPDATHSGGQIAFGPDGYLYLTFGDGGCCGPPNNENGQDRTNLYGTVLRIDVDDPSGDRNYGIPADNPYVGNTEGWREEIWAYGFRNPWRFSFDRETGELWLGDVGEATWEEVNRVEPDRNYGWATMEGPDCLGSTECDQTGLELPFYAYGRELGRSITGGFVYRGTQQPTLVGEYVFADFSSGRIWALSENDNGGPSVRDLFDTDLLISTFGETEQGELLLANFFNSRIYRVVDPKSTGGGLDPTAQPWALDLAGPNPVRDRTAFRLVAGENGSARVAVYDVLGREVAVLLDGRVLQGEQTLVFDTKGLAAGIYLIRLQTGNRSKTQRVTVLR